MDKRDIAVKTNSVFVSMLRIIFLLALAVVLFHIAFALQNRASSDFDLPVIARISKIVLPKETKPTIVQVANSGKIGVLDSATAQIKVFSPEGELLYETPAKLSDDDPIKRPRDFAFGQKGEIFVADTGNQRIIKFEPDGEIKILGKAGVYNGQFVMPTSVLLMAEHLYVLDTPLCKVSQFSESGTFLGKTGFKGTEAGSLQMPVSLARGPDDNLLVVDSRRSSVTSFDFLLHYQQQQRFSSKDGKFRLSKVVSLGRGLRFLFSRDTQEILVVYHSTVVAVLNHDSLGAAGSFWVDIAGRDNLLFILDSRNKAVEIFQIS